VKYAGFASAIAAILLLQLSVAHSDVAQRNHADAYAKKRIVKMRSITTFGIKDCMVFGTE
jgi:hypothetical protein